jgi:hypothetical protein
MIITPDLKILVHNYVERSGYKPLTSNNANETEREVLDISSKVISVQTSKSKSQPSGRFTIVIAPDRNWIATLAAGSWVTIHLQNQTINDDDLYGQKCLKMVGRIDSVRSTIQVDQETGARQTVFYIVGRDWGQVFESILYIDVMATFYGDDPMSMAIKNGGFDTELIKAAESGSGLPSTSAIVSFIINLWGKNGSSTIAKTLDKTTDGRIPAARLAPSSQFVLPDSLYKEFGNKGLVDNINQVYGKLTAVDSYKDEPESVGYINMKAVVGGVPVWNMIQSHSNLIVNEVLCDLRWDSKNSKKDKPTFAIYKRIKPFYLGQNLSDTGSVKLKPSDEKIKSLFFNLKRIDINNDSVLSLDYGNNWLDRINFVEIVGDVSLFYTLSKIDAGNAQKFSEGAAYYDPQSFSREGFKSLQFTTTFFPPPDKEKGWAIDSVNKWVPVVSSWHFDVHKMLNGTITLVGHDDYIGVGDNISVNSSLLFLTTPINRQKTDSTKLLAHVESVDHSFTIDPYGKRSLITTVTFSRGVITNSECNALFNPESFGVDNSTKTMSADQELLPNTIEVKE